MKLKKISDRIYYLPPEEATDRPVLGYVQGDKFTLAIDAGNSAQHVEKFYAAILAANKKLPDFTVITHWHWDHTFGMHAVTGKTIAGHLTNHMLQEVTSWEWSDSAMEQRLRNGDDIEFCDRCIKAEYSDRRKLHVVTADIEFLCELKLDLGGIHCVIMEIEAPHSEDCVLVYVPEEKIVFIGDADGGDYYNNDGKYDKKKLEKFIGLLEKLHFELCVLGHDEPQTKSQVLLYLKEEYEKL